MKLTGLVWLTLASGFVVAVSQTGQGRRSTDPPTMATGKLGQDLFLAIDHRDNSGVMELIKKGADANSRNGLGMTPLDIAAASHQPDVMKSLLGAGAKTDADSPYGTPLTFAAITGNYEGAKLLLDRGADVNTARVDGKTVLMMASTSGNPLLIAELLKRKANVNAKSYNNATALSYAARAGHVAVGQMLLQAGAAVDARDADGQTPLMGAAMTGHADFVKLLLQKGAKPNLRDSKGRTALLLTSAYGDYPEVIQALRAGGADANIADAKGRTAAAFAKVRGYDASSALLGKPSTVAVAAVKQSQNSGQAASRSLKLLQASMSEFSRSASCVSCHHEGLGRMVTASARDRGLTLDQLLMKTQKQRLSGGLTALRPLHEQALKSPEAMKQVPLIEMNEVNSGYSWILAGMAAQNDPRTPGTAAMAMVLARQQSPDGFWSFSLPRAPMQSSFFTFTALAVRSIKAYAPQTSATEIADRANKAKAWMMNAPAKTSDDLAFRLLGLKWAGASAEERRKAIDELRAAQRPDGGWSQQPDQPSDAYATGEALYALRVGGGIATSDSVYAHGVKFLLRTQEEDGSWFVNKRAIPANNYFHAGFPYGESQYASFNATCWATLALLETMGRK